MKVKEFILECQQNLKSDAEIDFYLVGYGFLKPISINMNADIDDPANENRGGVVFEVEQKLWDKD